MKILFAIMFLLIANRASAQQKVGVVSDMKILEQYPPAQKIQEELKALVQSWVDTAIQYEKAINEKAEGYRIRVASMSLEEQRNATDTLERMRRALDFYNQNKSNGNDGEFFRIRTERYAPIMEQIRKAIAKVAKREKVDLVTSRDSPSYVGGNVYDLTSDVLKELK